MNKRVRPIFWVVLGGAVLLAWVVSKRRSDTEAPKDAPSRPESLPAPEIITTLGTTTDQVLIIRKLFAAVASELPDIPFKAKVLVVAQALLESGWNTGRAAINANNWFNINAGGWSGPVYVAVNGDISYTKATCDKQGRPMNKKDSKGRLYCVIDQKWRKYATVNESVRDWWKLMQQSRFDSARSGLMNGDIQTFASGLRTARYYDAPLSDYVAGLKARVRRINNVI